MEPEEHLDIIVPAWMKHREQERLREMRELRATFEALRKAVEKRQREERAKCEKEKKVIQSACEERVRGILDRAAVREKECAAEKRDLLKLLGKSLGALVGVVLALVGALLKLLGSF